MPLDRDHIFKFYQGDEANAGVQAFSFRIATTDQLVGKSTVKVPKKLGDGNYGMVFEAPSTDAGSGTYALKILYQHRVDDKERILEELRIGVTLPRLLNPVSTHPDLDKYDSNFPKDGREQREWLVLPWAYSEDFRDFVGKEELERQDVKFSTYAYIMEKFDHSLKDLMEEPVPGERGGFGRLRSATLRDRECSAIPLLDQMSRGLQVLHAAGLRHQDIKPANIYMKKLGADLVLRLGDLGFLRPQDPTVAGTAAASAETVGIGTKHYRSVEQIDFNDVAECTVEVDRETGSATLTSRDPKFTHTIMRPGDLAFFSKSSSHRLMRIDALDKDEPEPGVVTVRVSHNVSLGHDETSSCEEEDPLVPDQKTQVTFFKNASAKTDLFGLGSIVYDMVTVGDSPERFYELLRRYDQPDVDIQSRILDRYPTYIAGTLEDTDLSAIFGRVNGQSQRGETVHAEVLSLLLKCMMSDATGSFYEQYKFADAEAAARTEQADETDPHKARLDAKLEAVKAWASVIKEVNGVGRAIGAGEFARHDTNVLTRPDPGESSASRETDAGGSHDHWRLGLSRVLEAYLRGEAPADYPGEPELDVSEPDAVHSARAYRWLMGGLLVSRIVAWTDRYLRERPGSLRSLSQEHVSVGSYDITAWREVVADSEAMLVRRLRTRDPLLTRIRPFASRFEPVWWRHGTRRIRLKELLMRNPGEGETGDTTAINGETQYSVEYDFLDFAFAATTVERSDFILAADSANTVVFRVEDVESESRLVVRLCEEEETARPGSRQERNLGSLEDGYLIKTPNAVDYYAGMLSVYLYHFLISYGAGQGDRIGDFPTSVYAGIRDFPVRFKDKPSASRQTTEGTRWQALKMQTLRLVVWLSLGGFSFGDNGARLMKESQRWGLINDELRDWYAALNAFGVKQGASVDNWNMLKMRKDDDTFKENVVGEFREIEASEWRKVCQFYIAEARAGSDRDPEVAKPTAPETKPPWWKFGQRGG